MKTMYQTALMVAAAVVLVTSVPVLAAATETDERIETAAKNSYVFQKYLKDEDITVKSTDGVVTLTGTVSEEPRKSLAEETVANLPEVKSVDNQLKVKGESGQENSDSWITMKVKTTLLFHRNVSAMTEVSTKGGIVTLQGGATSQAQKDLTTEYVKDVEGVTGVENEMTVANEPVNPDKKTMGQKVGDIGELIDDASITALVKMTLLYHRSTSALNTVVKTKDGLVTLDGKAENEAEKALATKYVQDVHGVKSVVNNMTIK